jgi:hypothetical protein
MPFILNSFEHSVMSAYTKSLFYPVWNQAGIARPDAAAGRFMLLKYRGSGMRTG